MDGLEMIVAEASENGKGLPGRIEQRRIHRRERRQFVIFQKTLFGSSFDRNQLGVKTTTADKRNHKPAGSSGSSAEVDLKNMGVPIMLKQVALGVALFGLTAGFVRAQATIDSAMEHLSHADTYSLFAQWNVNTSDYDYYAELTRWNVWMAKSYAEVAKQYAASPTWAVYYLDKAVEYAQAAYVSAYWGWVMTVWAGENSFAQGLAYNTLVFAYWGWYRLTEVVQGTRDRILR